MLKELKPGPLTRKSVEELQRAITELQSLRPGTGSGVTATPPLRARQTGSGVNLSLEQTVLPFQATYDIATNTVTYDTPDNVTYNYGTPGGPGDTFNYYGLSVYNILGTSLVINGPGFINIVAPLYINGVLFSSLSLTVENADATQVSFPCTEILADNDQGTAAFGRIHTTNSAGVALLDWQGLRLYKSGTGYVGPEPDIELIPGTNVTITVADDVADGRVTATISATGGTSPTATNGWAQLAGDYTATGTFANIGLSVTLPSAGTYAIDADVAGSVTTAGSGNLELYAVLYDTTAAAVIAGSAMQVCHVNGVPNMAGATFYGSESSSIIYTVAGMTTVDIQAKFADSTVGHVEKILAAGGSTDKLTRLRYIKIV